jgi:hypothetical protein
MPFLDNAAAWLDSTLATSDGELVTFRDGALEVPDVVAVIGATPVGFDLGNGILQSWLTTDFLIAANEISDPSGNEITPEVGQEITRIVRGKAITYRVCILDDGHCFRATDPSRRTLRIHTKQAPS